MMGRLIRVRLKAAETALAQGRIDAAFRLATAPDLVTETRAQKVLQQVGDQFFNRAEEHFKAQRYAEALIDLQRADLAGVKPQRVADLRTIVQAAVDEEARNQHSRHDRMAKAQDRIARGSLRAAEDILKRASHGDARAADLKQEAQARAQHASELLAEVRQYFADGHIATAIARFNDARQLHAKDKEIPLWEQKLVQHVLQSVSRSLSQGKINRAFEEMHLLVGVGDQRPDKTEQQAVLQRLAQAAEAIARGDYETARRTVLGLQHMMPDARWLKQASNQLKQLDDLVTELSGGPLGLVPVQLADQPTRADRSPVTPTAVALNETIASAPPGIAGGALPNRLLVLVDGAGSYLLIRNHRASIGRAATADQADVPIISDISKRHAEIVRVDEDYFLYANLDVNVGGQNLRQKLLQSGDRIVLGRRAKLTFNLPSRKSPSAVLDLSDSAKMPKDVRRVILFDRFVTIGRQSNSHIVTHSAGEDLVLLERNGQLWVRHRVNGKGDNGRLVVLGQPFELAGVSMVVEPYTG